MAVMIDPCLFLEASSIMFGPVTASHGAYAADPENA
jgi:hypothetical protein